MYKLFVYFIKRFYKFILVPLILSIFLIVVGAIRTNKALILKGDTSKFTSVVNIDTDYEIKGSFSTVYVSTMDKSTVLQNWIVSDMPTVESYTMSPSSVHISDIDDYKASKIQYNSSIENAIVLAYKEAMKDHSNISLVYTFGGFDITYYQKGSSFSIGDRIIAIQAKANDNVVVTRENEADLRRVINSQKYIGDVYTILRDGKEMNITLTENDAISAYSRYDIDYDATIPHISIKSTTVGGPSGGLLQTLSIYNQLVEEDLTHGLKIAGTGTIAYTGAVGAIGGIREKIPTAFDDHIDVFFCVAANYDDAKEAYDSIIGHDRMKLIRIETFYDALEYLKEGYKNDFQDL